MKLIKTYIQFLDLARCNYYGYNILHYAVLFCHYPLVRFLIDEMGMNPDQKSGNSLCESILHIAMRTTKHPDAGILIHYLYQVCNTNALNSNGYTAKQLRDKLLML